MRFLFRLLLVVLLAAAVGAVVAGKMQKRRLAEMPEEDLRAWLAAKMEGRVPDEKIPEYQDKAVAAIKGKWSTSSWSEVEATTDASPAASSVATTVAVEDEEESGDGEVS